MIIKKYVLFALLCFTFSALAQNKKRVDSLKALITKYDAQRGQKLSIRDTLKVDLLTKLSSAYNYDQPTIAIAYAKKGLQIAQAIEYPKGEAEAYFHMGRIFGISGKFEDSKIYTNKALEIYQVLKKDLKVADCYNNLGAFYAGNKDLSGAAFYFLKALKIYERLDDKDILAGAYVNLGTVHRDIEEYDRALAYYSKGLSLTEEKDQNSLGYAYLFVNMADIYKIKKDPIKELEWYKKAQNIAEKSDDIKLKKIILSSLGEFYILEKEYKKAEGLILEALQFSDRLDNDVDKNADLILLGYCYYKLGNSIKGLSYIKNALQTAESKNYLRNKINAYTFLVEIYDESKKYELAYKNHVLFKEANDSLFSMEKNKKVTQMQMQYEFDKVQDEAQQAQVQKEFLLTQETDKERSIKYGVMAALFCVTILSLGIFSNLRKNQKQKNIIAGQKAMVEKQNEAIQQSLTEKETLLREIHHRVKNNLQIISSLLNIQSQHIVDENVLSSIQEGQSRVQAMSLIHQNLYQSEHLSNVDIENYLRELVVYLSEMFVGDDKSIQVDVDASNIQFDIDTAIPLGLIVNELVSNAYKYAFDKRNSGKIQISIKAINDVDYELKVNDDGNGLPPDFDPKKGKSLGLKLVNILSRQLRGSMSSKSDNGASFIIQFKDIKAYVANAS